MAKRDLAQTLIEVQWILRRLEGLYRVRPSMNQTVCVNFEKDQWERLAMIRAELEEAIMVQQTRTAGDRRGEEARVEAPRAELEKFVQEQNREQIRKVVTIDLVDVKEDENDPGYFTAEFVVKEPKKDYEGILKDWKLTGD